MRMQERIDAYARAFPDRPPLQLVTEGAGTDRREVAYGQWCIGNQYGATGKIYGSYPPGYVNRVMAMFPDMAAADVLHLFSGSLPAGPYSRCDVSRDAEYQCGAYELPAKLQGFQFRLVLADPPYSAEDAKQYGTPMVNRGKVFQSLAKVVPTGGHVVWLDCVWPMHRKSEWRTVGRIGLTRSTNHRVRMVSIFERVAA